MIVFAVVLLAGLAAAQEPTRPEIPSTFEAYYNISVKGREPVSHNGSGRWYSDSSAQHELEVNTYGRTSEEHMRVYRLERFDMHKEYILYGNETHCEEHELPEFHPPFGFTAEAHYEGTKVFDGKTLDIWAARHDEFQFVLGVSPTDVHVPVFLERTEMATTAFLVFYKFTPTTPPSTSFNIPPACQK